MHTLPPSHTCSGVDTHTSFTCPPHTLHVQQKGEKSSTVRSKGGGGHEGIKAARREAKEAPRSSKLRQAQQCNVMSTQGCTCTVALEAYLQHESHTEWSRGFLRLHPPFTLHTCLTCAVHCMLHHADSVQAWQSFCPTQSRQAGDEGERRERRKMCCGWTATCPSACTPFTVLVRVQHQLSQWWHIGILQLLSCITHYTTSTLPALTAYALSFNLAPPLAARKASCDTSTLPIILALFFPSFCFFSSFCFREKSPPPTVFPLLSSTFFLYALIVSRAMIFPPTAA
mmetsp:Transcript_29006/g.74462  ORF Transcript_29006/g.74462 Transcript_29006/m.74462 type:complete len:285 (-) Transcript_29006:1875-2729(-)